MPRLLIVLVSLIPFASCNRASTPANDSTTSAPTSTVAGAVPFADPSGDWVRPARDYASSRFSPLDQITPETVKNPRRLRLRHGPHHG